MFSSTTEYALRAIVHLASNPAKACTAAQIAEATQIPAGYVSKVLQDLGRASLVTSQRGPNGGFVLARPAADISVLDVINAVDPIKRILVCPLGIAAHGTRLCKLHRKLDSAMAQAEETLGRAMIADMLEPGPGGPLCRRADGQAGLARDGLTVRGRKPGSSRSR